MGFAGPTGFSAGNVNSSSSTWAMWGSATAAAGELIVLVMATDNITTTDTNSNNHTSISATETWTKVYEYTNGQGSANAGATVSIWYTIATGNLSAATLNLSGAVAAKAYVYDRFTRDTGATISWVGPSNSATTPAVLATDGADPASMTCGSLTSREYLFVRGIANETNSDTAVTPTSAGLAWTAFAGGGGISASSTGGGAAANMAAGGEWVIGVLTSATSDPTWVAGDNANILMAFYEVPSAARVPYFNPMPAILAQ